MGTDDIRSALSRTSFDFRRPNGVDLIERTQGFHDWLETCFDYGIWSYGRATDQGPRRHVAILNDRGERTEGVNFASQDYLSLAAHPEINAAAHEAIDTYGVHSAGSPALVGNTSSSLSLEEKIADFVKADYVSLFPTGWAAGFGTITGLVRPFDHIVIDALAHACLHSGAQAATKNISLFRHNQVEDARKKLAKIRAKDTENGILLITEGLFSMDSDSPDLAAMQELADEYQATLFVDVAHDLGSMGPTGRGVLEKQNMLGKVDIVMGSFSKTFASNGGFVATRKCGVREYLRFYSSPNTFSNALSPIQTAVVSKAFDIVASDEGRTLRDRNARNGIELRSFLKMAGFDVYGTLSPIVCAHIGEEDLGRVMGRKIAELGLIANLVEYPAVSRKQARFRFQVMANHTSHDTIAASRILANARSEVTDEKGRLKPLDELSWGPAAQSPLTAMAKVKEIGGTDEQAPSIAATG
ncbi:putative 8-amino-7-oxononanoate synthase [Parvularcula bermudensis HTCC2503]|uniref:Putative 8-amino-7-oxononanoate synthase n=1 Tax=Parvularcula bermudensis (strain ATCC BAA-594 / HTCC2503 / KCTC 12087) TaxID=314260 RepID=E0TFS2_PARBH|nr:aminotransferase class I/II-fold pyridoxal phosphate-dependent enzyme [Parvularcula bermudensis]ADM09087.1 putative 8-amino-7-oxononanoate synthase [Parvularcula bermudensis HTCC2503]